MPPLRRAMLALTLPLALCACAVPTTRPGEVVDPYEAQNRRVHAFNVAVDRALFRPASSAYGAGLPQPVKEGVENFATNLSTPSHFVNDVLQGRPGDAGHNFFRFALNSTLGVAGVFDPASSFGLAPRPADFGQTLHAWGLQQGAYLELPLLGPSTQRDAAGTVVDLLIAPVRRSAPEDARPVVFATRVGAGLGDRYAFGATIDQVLYESADSYAQTRSIYLQNRRFELAGETTEDFFDPYDDLVSE